VTHDAGRPPGHGPERHAIGITRTCLASGTVQLPFALAGILPEGELLVHDAEADEPLVLWSDPPRRLAGLAPFFERHELQVNDSVVLEIRGDDLRLATAKRPRRARPAVRPSTWHSLHDERPEPEAPTVREAPDADRRHGEDEAHPAPRPQGPDAPAAADPAAHEAYAPTAHDDVPWDATPASDAPATATDVGSRPTETRPTGTPPIAGEDEDDAPRAPRVAVRPLGDADAGAAAPGGRPVRASDASALRPGPWARLGRLARSIFGGGADASAEREADAARRARDRDWTRAWDEDEEDDELAPTPEFLDDAPPPAPARADRPTPIAAEPIAADPGQADPGDTDRAYDEPAYDEPSDDEPAHADRAHADRFDAPAADAATEPAETEDDEDDPAPRAQPAPEDLPEATPLFPDAVDRAPARRPADETPSGVPARAERFLGGDLRTRLLRYLESPEMGSIAQADRIAKRFDLDVETATEMLADIADEPPDGLRLRPTREGAWRIERTLRR
jgi:hypothetical protein